MENCHGGSVRDCEIHDLNEGLVIRNGYGIVVSGVVSEKISGKAFVSSGRASVIFSGCYAELTGYGVYVQDTQGPTTIQGSFLWSKYPVYINDADNIIISGNKLQCDADDGFNITSNVDCDMVRSVNYLVKGFEYSRMDIPELDAEDIVNLDEGWRFMPDYKNQGFENGWLSLSKWDNEKSKPIVAGKDYGWRNRDMRIFMVRVRDLAGIT